LKKLFAGWGMGMPKLAEVVALFASFAFGQFVPAAAGVADRPLVVDDRSHIVILEYEAWFGPHAVTFQNAEAMPLLRSEDMEQVGGGYDSADPHVIEQHVRWMQYVGVDAASIDVTNNVGCIFSTGPVSKKFCNPPDELFRRQNRNILKNTANLYPAWAKLATPLKLVPLLGCQTPLDLAIGSDGKSGFQKEVEYFGRLTEQYPQLSVRYFGRPLMLVYVGTPVNLNIVDRAKAILHKTGLDTKYTIRIDAGYLDSQPAFWANPNKQPDGPIRIAPQYGFWSVVDRYKPAFSLFPTYNIIAGSRGDVENFTVSIATAGQNGWGCPQPVYCPDDALRYGSDGSSYVTLENFMTLAGQLQPRFLILDQFNEFTMPDEGWNADTSDDSEPTQRPNGWGFSALQAMKDEITKYRRGIDASFFKSS
jgi:hypothetical protein